MSRIHSPWILTLFFALTSATASAQDDAGPIARLVGRLRQPSTQHQHQHVHVQQAVPTYEYQYTPQVAAVEPDAEAVAAPADEADASEPIAQEAAPAEAAQEQVQVQPQEATYAAYAPTGDPYGFMNVLNRIRASAGLHPLAHDPNLSSWAQQNNAEQCRRGLGHHVNPAGIQNCAYNYTDADSTAAGWMNSPGHRDNMLSPSATHFGIAFGPGPYWTLNAR